jgi:hypothetical protein
LEIIPESKDFFVASNEPDPLKRHWFPLYTSLIMGLELQFKTQKKYCFEHHFYDLKEVIELFFKFYDKHQDWAIENSQRLNKNTIK